MWSFPSQSPVCICLQTNHSRMNFFSASLVGRLCLTKLCLGSSSNLHFQCQYFGGCRWVSLCRHMCEGCSLMPQMLIWLRVQKMPAFKTSKLPSEQPLTLILASSTGHWMGCEMSSEGAERTWVNILQSLSPYGSFFIMYINSTLAPSKSLSKWTEPASKENTS